MKSKLCIMVYFSTHIIYGELEPSIIWEVILGVGREESCDPLYPVQYVGNFTILPHMVVHMYIHAYMYIHVYMYVHVHTCAHVHTCVHVQVWLAVVLKIE